MPLAKLVATITVAVLLMPSTANARRHDSWHDGHRHHDHDGNTAAGVALGVGILGIAAAVAASNKRKADERRAAYSYGYGNSYGGDSYSPARDVYCYRGEQRCYYRGQVSYEWTDQQFAYDPYRRGY